MAAPLGLETRQQKGIFVAYISLWVSYGLLNELAKRHAIHFNSASAVILQSFIKLTLASYLFLTQEAQEVLGHERSLKASLQLLATQIQTHRDLLIRYLIPSGLYALYDILSYINLRAFDASTYFLLLQFRMVITGLLHQFMFQKTLNRNQWIALAVVTFGCVLKSLGASTSGPSNSNHSAVSVVSYGLLMVQLLSSTFAGVYNEVLLKKQSKISLNLQNIFMYLDSIVCIGVMLALGLSGQSLSEAIAPANLRVLFSLYVLPMVLIMSFIGLATSLFLKALDSVRKAIASALELVFLPLLCAVLFGMPVSAYLVASVVCVASGVYIYSIPVERTPDSTYLPLAQVDQPPASLKE